MLAVLLSVSFLLQLSAANDDWCTRDHGCLCVSYRNISWFCKNDKGKTILEVFPGTVRNPHWHVTCMRGLISDFESANLSLGTVEYLTLENCTNFESEKTLIDVFKSVNIQGLIDLKLDLVESESRLTDNIFQGLEQGYPSFRSLELYRLAHADTNLLASLENLKKLVLRQSRNVPFLNNNFLRHLKNLEHVEIYDNTNLKKLPVGTFDSNTRLKVVNLSSNGFESLPPTIFLKLVDLRVLILNHNYIEYLPIDLLSGNHRLRHFSMLQDFCSADPSVNCTRVFPEDFFSSAKSLETFEYSWCKLVSKGRIDDVVFKGELPRSLKNLKLGAISKKLSWSDYAHMFASLHHLEKLDLTENNITFLDEYFESLPPTLEELDLRGNQLSCDQCRTLTFEGLKTENCKHGGSVLNTRNETELRSVRNKFCDRSVSLIVAVVVVALLLIVVVLLAVCWLDRLRASLYNSRFVSNFFRPDTTSVETKTDVFISYAQEDSGFVEYLVDTLEGRNESQVLLRTFKCCVHERDWIVGNAISENISCSVLRSKRTVIVLSHHFLKSPYCLQEFNEAYARKRIILIVRADLYTNEILCNSNQIRDPQLMTIKNYMKSFTYLREDDPRFWTKLVYRLPHKPMFSTTPTSPKRKISEFRRLLSREERDAALP